MKKEIRSLTGIRGLAALYVASYHFLEPFDTTLSDSLLNFIRHGYNGVDIFFILSGFVIALSSKKLFDQGFRWKAFLVFMKRRFARVYPIYLVMTLLTFALSFKYLGLNDLLFNLLLLQVLPPMQYIVDPSWSLSAEWIAYLLFPLFLLFVYKYKTAIWNLLVLIIAFAVLAYISFNNGNFMNGFRPLPPLNGSLDRFYSIAACLRCFSEYLIGMIIYKIYTSYKIEFGKYYHYPSLPVSLLIIFFLCLHNSDLMLVFLFALLIFSLSTDTGIVARFFGWKPVYFLGEISYSLYLIHALLVRIDLNLYARFKSFHVPCLNLFNDILFFVSLILLAYLSFQFIEIPMRKYLRDTLNA